MLIKHNIVKGDGDRLWIIGNQQKTKDPIEISMLTQAKAIYYKYEEFRNVTGFVLPQKAHQHVNRQLREIMGIVGIDKYVHHHIARHTFATTIVL